MIYGGRIGVPAFAYDEYAGKTKDYVVLIPVINEGGANFKGIVPRI